MESDTPRSDATDLYDYQTAVDFARQLERELAAAKDENARLEKERDEMHSFAVSSDERNERLEKEVSLITDRVDLMVDEFRRIKACSENSEVNGLCDRAITTTVQNVPVIAQRDGLLKEVDDLHAKLATAREALEIAKPFVGMTVKTDASCAVFEKIKQALAAIGGEKEDGK